MSRRHRDDEPAHRARRDVERMNQQSEKLLGAGSNDAPETGGDRIEVIGRRIGRAIGYVLGAALLIHLLATYVFG